MLYTFGFVNRRSRVQLSKAAPHLDRLPWPTVAYSAGHVEVPDPSTVPMPSRAVPAMPRRLGATLYWPVTT